MGPEKPLPYNEAFKSTEAYVGSLLDLVGGHDLLRVLCGGVHILDFFTSDPDLYSQVIPQEWRVFFAQHEIMDILDLFMREDLEIMPAKPGWRNGPSPPQTLIDFITTIRTHLLDREPTTSQCARNRAMKPTQKLARHVSVGMNVKKVHEVGLFASYINNFTAELSATTDHEITHLVDFGSGQNYLGRVLASEPYNRNIVAIESKDANAVRAKEFDVTAKLAVKEQIMRNKKLFRAGGDGSQSVALPQEPPTPPPEPTLRAGESSNGDTQSKGTIQYVNYRIADGNLENVVSCIPALPDKETNCLTISLHSCGNLLHHGLRSITINPAVKAVAMVGCCYNLLTERLGPATYKYPELRPMHPRVEREGEACDPTGFPMSERFCNYSTGDGDWKGIKLNITARMMAVQAPQNWGEKDSEGFFTRHFYRALLQKVFLDYGVVGPPKAGGAQSPVGHSSGTPIVIGSLRKSCYASFTTYVRGALAKLIDAPGIGSLIRETMSDIRDEEIAAYEDSHRHRKKELSVVWSLMAFSAGVIEAAIVVDRYLWLKEQKEVKEAWVESVFDYRISPRNLVVVGVKG